MKAAFKIDQSEGLNKNPLLLKLLISVIILLLYVQASSAQFVKTIDISSGYDDNVYRSPEEIDEIVTDLSLNLDYQPKESDINLYYNGSYLMYNELNKRNFYMNGLGFNMIKALDEEAYKNFYLGADWTFRKNGDDYNYYDYNQIYAYTNLSFNLGWIFIRTGYNYRYRNYSNFSDLSNNRHYGFIQLNKSFQTRTTIILESDIGHKSFAGQNTTIASGSSGNYSDEGQNRGFGRGPDINIPVQETTTTTVSDIPSLSQAVFLARIAQSLHTKIGIYIQYRKQISLTDETSYVNSDNYYQDEELFDDPFSYESDVYSSQLTWMMPWQMKIQIGGAFGVKNYISEIAFESIVDTVGLAGIREDEEQSIYVNFTKTFYMNKRWINSLRFTINYGYIHNESNSYWYNYKNAVINSGMQWTF